MNEYITLGIVSAFVCLLIAAMFMKSRFHYSIKAIASIVLVAAIIYNWELFVSVLGFPIAERPPDRSVILYTVTKTDKNAIYAVIDGPIPRSYTIPYSEQLQKKISDAKKELDKIQGKMIYRDKSQQQKGKGTGKSKDNKGKQSEGKESQKTESQKGNDSDGEENESVFAKMKEKGKELVKKLKTTVNISEEDEGESDIDPETREQKRKEGRFTNKMNEEDKTIPDDIEIISILPPK